MVEIGFSLAKGPIVATFMMTPPSVQVVDGTCTLAHSMPLQVGESTGPAVAASGDDKGTSAANAQANYYRSIATSTAPLLRRSQGLQWARGQMALLCSDYANRRISRAEYAEARKFILEKSTELVNAEIPYLPTFDTTINADGTMYRAPNAPNPPDEKKDDKAAKKPGS